MNLLIITQKIDEEDSVLGFFVRWVEEFAKRCVQVTVACLEKCAYHLPSNAKMLYLGKDYYKRLEEVKYAKRF